MLLLPNFASSIIGLFYTKNLLIFKFNETHESNESFHQALL